MIFLILLGLLGVVFLLVWWGFARIVRKIKAAPVSDDDAFLFADIDKYYWADILALTIIVYAGMLAVAFLITVIGTGLGSWAASS